MLQEGILERYLNNTTQRIGQVVDFDHLTDRLCPLDFTAANTELSPEIVDDTVRFSAWVDQQRGKSGARYGIGGYGEHRTIYARSLHFNTAEEPRRLHLGVDIWGPAGTPIYNFMEGRVHSFHFNDVYGDYGGTIILQYELDGLVFHALYGHLNKDSLGGLKTGKHIAAGALFARFGVPAENGNWPPHLHFQLIMDMQGFEGDYPGVCRFSIRKNYMINCPDPDLILKHTFRSALY